MQIHLPHRNALSLSCCAIFLLAVFSMASVHCEEPQAESAAKLPGNWPNVAIAANHDGLLESLSASKQNTFQDSMVPGDNLELDDDLESDEDLEKDLALDGEDVDDILNADIGQLSRTSVVAPSFDMEVSTVARTESTVGKTPAAIFIITADMIRRSGARSIPEVLRMAPGVHVAKIDSSNWSVSIRGFGGRFANKLLVQIDGRTVYTPLFGGVFWDVQDVMLEDVERIEVIRGPGATVWGANAVNGVINILTKSSQDTTGAVAIGGGGSFQNGFSEGRIGGQTAGGTYWRVYGKQFERDHGVSPTASDDSRMKRTGFRMDSSDSRDRFTLQGDIYDGTAGSFVVLPNPPPTGGMNTIPFDTPLRGGNVLARWTRSLGNDSEWSLQSYYDRAERYTAVGSEVRNIYDIDFQLRFPLGPFQELLWGVAYRASSDRFIGDGFVLDMQPTERTIDIASLFVQDKLTLISDLLTLWAGVRVSHNDFTGVEVQPNMRLLWTPDERHAWWASFSRAVRTPTRIDDNMVSLRILPDLSGSLPVSPGTFGILTGNTRLQSEEVLAYEIGYRAQPIREFSWDAALYYHDYRLIRNFGPTANPLVSQFQNLTAAETYGVEIGSNLQLHPDWTVRTAYTFMRLQSHSPPTAGLQTFGEGGSPRNQVYLQSSWNLGGDLQFDLIGRYVDNLTNPIIPSYATMDLRLGWYPTNHLELAVMGRNLLDAQQIEYPSDEFTGIQATEVPRSIYGMATWRY